MLHLWRAHFAHELALPSISKPLRTVLKWQVIATAVAAVLGMLFGGRDGAFSAVLGGMVNVTAGIVYALLLGVGASRRRVGGPHLALVTMFRAEAGKVLAIIAQLWGVLSIYRDVVHVAFFGAFVITVVVFSMAFFVRE